MDRFIGKILLSKINSSVCLKSNMDRFIAAVLHIAKHRQKRLKSNMDRFIALTYITLLSFVVV